MKLFAIGAETDILTVVKKVLIFWQSFGPYHVHRCRAVAARMDNLVALSFWKQAPPTETYQWEKNVDEVSEAIFEGQKIPELKIVFVIKIIGYFIKFFKKHKVSVAFIPSYSPIEVLVVALVSKLFGAKLVLMLDSHEFSHPTLRAPWFEKFKSYLIGLFDFAFVAGTLSRRYLIKLGFDSAKIVIGYDAVDVKYFQSQKPKFQQKDAEAIPFLLMVSRFAIKKNHQNLIEAFSQLKKDSSAKVFPLVFAGYGELESQTQELCQTHHLSWVDCSAHSVSDIVEAIRQQTHDVFYCGNRNVRDLSCLYYAAGLAILPSTFEEWGLVVNEALACGLPCMVSQNVGCAPDLIIDHRFNPVAATGILTDVDVPSLVESLKYYHLNFTEFKSLSENCVKKSAQFSCEIFAERVLEISAKLAAC